MAHVAIRGSQSSGARAEMPPLLNLVTLEVWVQAHEELSRLAKCRALLEWEEGRGLLTALRKLGFLESEARRALDQLRTNVDLDHSDTEGVVRAALRILTSALETTMRAAT